MKYIITFLFIGTLYGQTQKFAIDSSSSLMWRNTLIAIDTTWTVKYIDVSVIDTSTVTAIYEENGFLRGRKVFKLGFRTESNHINFRQAYYDSIWYLDRGLRFNRKILMEFK